MSQFDEVRQAKTIHKGALLARQNVVGVGVGYKTTSRRTTAEMSVVVLVRKKLPPVSLSAEAFIPQEVDGVHTDVVEVGEIRPLAARTDRWRPAPGGISLGHYRITAGTFGSVVYDRETGARLILSNNHVLANSNDAQPGDPILQPGPADGGRLEFDMLARLERFAPLRYNLAPASCNLAKAYARLGNALARGFGSHHQLQVIQALPSAYNLVDAAVARPLDANAVLDETLEIGTVTGVLPAELGMSVQKSGRTTAHTTGEINILDATVTVSYEGDRTATFENQIITTPMSSGGDSGSLLVAGDSANAVGLLFAGSDLTTIHNPIEAVFETLKVRLGDRASQKTAGRQVAIERAQRAQMVRSAYQDALMSKANVVGVGVGLQRRDGVRSDEIGLVVMVRHKVPESLLAPEDAIPCEIDGVPVDVKEVGEIQPVLSE